MARHCTCITNIFQPVINSDVGGTQGFLKHVLSNIPAHAVDVHKDCLSTVITIIIDRGPNMIQTYLHML